MYFSVLIISTSHVYLETSPRPSCVGDWRRSCGNDVGITASREKGYKITVLLAKVASGKCITSA